MKLGALLGPIADATNQNSLAEQARMLEAEGYSSLWTAQAIGRGFMMTDPFVTLSIAAAVTHEVELGTAILQLPFYEVADVALKSFSLMQASGNRLLLGVGAGSTESDHLAHHGKFEQRFRSFNEKLTELKTVFATGQCHGVDLAPWENVQGGPPLIYGTWGAGVSRAAEEFDAWIGSAMHRSIDQLEEAIAGYRAAGGTRAIATTIVLTPNTDLGELGEMMQRLSKVGFDDAVVMFTPGAPDAASIRNVLV